MKHLLINKQKLLLLIGLILVTFLLWNRLIRIRLPKDIPFTLTDLNFSLLCCICLALLVTIFITVKTLLKAKTTIKLTWNQIFDDSLQELDAKVRDYKPLWSYIYILSINIFSLCFKYRAYTKYIYIVFQLPKIILPIILFIDVFFFGHIELFYKGLILLLIPLLYRYIYHSLHNVYTIEIHLSDERILIRIEKLVDNELVLCTMSPYPTHYFIQETTLERLKIRDNDHVFNLRLSDKYMHEHPDESNKQWQEAYDRFTGKYTFFSNMYEILNTYTLVKKQLDPILNLIATTVYLICWSYILYSGTYELSDAFITMVKIMQNHENPFSLTPL